MARRDRLRKKLQKLKKLIPAVTVTLTTVPFAVWSPTASAFFPPVWPVSPPVVVVPPVVVPPVVVPPVSPPPFVPPPPPPIIVPPVSPPPIVVPPVSPPPNGVPEPATVVSGLIGLAAVAGYRWKRRQEKPTE
jgi:hypothetical protein